MYWKSYCTTSNIGIDSGAVISRSIGVGEMLKYFVTGKALSCKLSCKWRNLGTDSVIIYQIKHSLWIDITEM